MDAREMTARGRELTAVEEEEARRIAVSVAAGARAEALKIGRLLASRKNSELFGATEFEVRDAVPRIGTRALETALETALEERKKRGLAGPVASDPRAGRMPTSRDTRRKQRPRCWGRLSIRGPTIPATIVITAGFPRTRSWAWRSVRQRAREVIALAGVEDAFAVSAERVLHRLSGSSVSAPTVQRVTETVGDDLAGHREHGDDITPDESWDWSFDAEGPRVA